MLSNFATNQTNPINYTNILYDIIQYMPLSAINRLQNLLNYSFFSYCLQFTTLIATTQPTTQNNLKQLLLGWLYYQ